MSRAFNGVGRIGLFRRRCKCRPMAANGRQIDGIKPEGRRLPEFAAESSARQIPETPAENIPPAGATRKWGRSDVESAAA